MWAGGNFNFIKKEPILEHIVQMFHFAETAFSVHAQQHSCVFVCKLLAIHADK